MSERASMSSPRTCSGDMYATVPAGELATVCRGAAISTASSTGPEWTVFKECPDSSFARPKSRIFACLCRVTKSWPA